MILRVFAILLLLNIAVQAVQAKADDAMYSWQSAYSQSLTQGMGTTDDNDLETGDCLMRAAKLVLDRLIFDRPEVTSQQAAGQPRAIMSFSDYGVDVSEDEIQMELSWTF